MINSELWFSERFDYKKGDHPMTNALTKNPSVLSWIEDKVALVQPDKIVWIDGLGGSAQRSARRGLLHRRNDQA